MPLKPAIKRRAEKLKVITDQKRPKTEDALNVNSNYNITTDLIEENNDLVDENKNKIGNNIEKSILVLDETMADLSVRCDCVCHDSDSEPISLRGFGTQTTEWAKSNIVTEVHQFNLGDVRLIICMLIDFIPNFNAIHRRVLSLAIYVLLRLVNVSYSSCTAILDKLDLLHVSNCNLWVTTMSDEGDICTS